MRLKTAGQKELLKLAGFLFSPLLLYKTELILIKIITFRNYLSIHKDLISLKMSNNYECREIRNIFLLWDCRKKKSEILELNIMMNINKSSVKHMNSNIKSMVFPITSISLWIWLTAWLSPSFSWSCNAAEGVNYSIFIFIYCTILKKIWQDSTKPQVVLYILHAEKLLYFCLGRPL